MLIKLLKCAKLTFMSKQLCWCCCCDQPPPHSSPSRTSPLCVALCPLECLCCSHCLSCSLCLCLSLCLRCRSLFFPVDVQLAKYKDTNCIHTYINKNILWPFGMFAKYKRGSNNSYNSYNNNYSSNHSNKAGRSVVWQQQQQQQK